MSVEHYHQVIDPAALRVAEDECPEDAHSWNAVVLTTDTERGPHCNPEEIWNWCLARMAKLGQLQPGHARLWALLHWTPGNIDRAVQDAWELLRQMHCSLEEKQATWEYLSGECLARAALDMPLEHPGARREPVDLQVV